LPEKAASRPWNLWSVASSSPFTSACLARTHGLRADSPGALYTAAAALSNLVSNVPAVMLLLPFAKFPQAGPVLALSSTLAGNLVIVGSIANIIVVELAARHGVKISWGCHARTGIPVTLLTLGFAWLVL
jgi:Na+/H+ antiporter NhaD/arsenite permease-like protein